MLTERLEYSETTLLELYIQGGNGLSYFWLLNSLIESRRKFSGLNLIYKYLNRRLLEVIINMYFKSLK